MRGKMIQLRRIKRSKTISLLQRIYFYLLYWLLLITFTEKGLTCPARRQEGDSLFLIGFHRGINAITIRLKPVIDFNEMRSIDSRIVRSHVRVVRTHGRSIACSRRDEYTTNKRTNESVPSTAVSTVGGSFIFLQRRRLSLVLSFISSVE